MQTDIAQIFLPRDMQDREGYLIGIQSIQSYVRVQHPGACLYDSFNRGRSRGILCRNDGELQDIDQRLQNSQHQSSIQQFLGTRLQVFGVLQQSGIFEEQLDTWVHLKRQRDVIELKSLLICGYEYRVKCCIIYYDRLSGPQQITFNIEQLSHRLLTRLIIEEENKEQYSQMKVCLANTHEDLNPYEILNLDAKARPELGTREQHELQHTLTHINMRRALTSLLSSVLNGTDIIGIVNTNLTLAPRPSYYEMYLRSDEEVIRTVTDVAVYLCRAQRIVFLMVLKLAEFKLPLSHRSFSELPIMKHFLMQIKYKLSIMTQWDTLALIITSKETSMNTSLIFRAYHQLFAGITFMVVDTLLGILSLLFLYFNVQWLLDFIHKYGSTIHIAVLSEEVEWLMGFPAGLKTNRPLNLVMGQVILQVILFWNRFTTFVTPYEPYLIQIMMLFCLFGVTFQVAFASDLINLCTVHVYYIYRSLMFLYREIGIFSYMLYRATKDKYFDSTTQKWSVKEFHWDQKILAMFFCFFMVMMLPTIALYYFWFLLIVLFIYIVNVLLNFLLQVLNHFPMFLIIQYYRNPALFPVSVTLDVPKFKSNNKDTVEVSIQANKMPFKYLFTQFLQRIVKLQKMVNIPAVLKSGFLGYDIMATIRQQALKQQRKRSRHFKDFIGKPRQSTSLLQNVHL